MDRALRLLLVLRLTGWLRRLRRAASTVKGLLVAVVGGMFIAGWLLSVVAFMPEPTEEHLEAVREVGPVVLLLFCLLNYLLAAGERVLAFTPAEVNLLFPAPFSRRQLLLYKISVVVFSTVLLGFFLGLMLRQHASSLLTSMVGWTLAMLFLQLFSLTVALLVSIVGAQAYNRQRRIVLVLLALAAAAFVGMRVLGRWERSALDVARDVRHHPAAAVLLAPFEWQINTLTADRVWPDLVGWAALSLLASVVLLVVILLLDVQYLETAAAASEKIYRRLERLRRGGLAAAGLPLAEKARWSLASLPRWGGVGPLAWRQLLGALRSFWWMITLGVFLAACLVPMVMLANEDSATEGAASGALVGALFSVMLFMTLFLPSLLPFDFRSDIDRMEVLKTLPLATWKIVVGEMSVPVVIVTVLQFLILGAMQVLLPEPQPLLLALVPFLTLIDFLIFTVENLFFLWFPTRQLAVTPGDVQNFGRILVLWFAKLLLLGALSLIGALLGVGVYFASGGSLVAAGAVVLVFLAGCAAGALPLLCLAFNNFDVSRDTPP